MSGIHRKAIINLEGAEMIDKAVEGAGGLEVCEAGETRTITLE